MCSLGNGSSFVVTWQKTERKRDRYMRQVYNPGCQKNSFTESSRKHNTATPKKPTLFSLGNINKQHFPPALVGLKDPGVSKLLTPVIHTLWKISSLFLSAICAGYTETTVLHSGSYILYVAECSTFYMLEFFRYWAALFTFPLLPYCSEYIVLYYDISFLLVTDLLKI